MTSNLIPEAVELRRTERYILFEPFAKGGMASVHFAVLQGALGFSRIVAIKRLRQELATNQRFVTMLVEEARLSSRIRHLNVVPTLDVISTDGEVFVSMEYVCGEALNRLMASAAARGEMIPIPIAVAIMMGVLRGLQAAHEACSLDDSPLEIVHRDVSPHNILIGVSGVPRLLDFGVAHSVDHGDDTHADEFKGKLAYAAPEQLSGGLVTARTDIYAAGIVLWELITGARLFDAPTDQLTYRRAREAVIPELHETVFKDRRDVPGRDPGQLAALAPVVKRALARDPGDRYATAAEMVAALEHAVRPAPLAAISAWVQAAARDKLAAERAAIKAIEGRIGTMSSGDRAGADPSLPRAPRATDEPGARSAPPRAWLVPVIAGASAFLGAAAAVRLFVG